jgi:hypothetical protein
VPFKHRIFGIFLSILNSKYVGKFQIPLKPTVLYCTVQNKHHLACTSHNQQQAAQLKKKQHHDPSSRRLPAASILMLSAISFVLQLHMIIATRRYIFLYETKSSLFYLLSFSLCEIQGQSRRRKSSVLLALDVGNGLNYPYLMQFKNDQNTNVITSNPTTLDDMGGGFVSDRFSNNDGRMCGGVWCSMMTPPRMLVEEWTGQEGVEPHDRANSIDSFSGFSDPGGRFSLQMRVFTITIGWVFAYPIDIAATVILNRCPSKKMFSNLFLYLAVLFFHGFVYFPSQPQHSLVVNKLRPLLNWRSPFVKKNVLFIIGTQRRSRRSSKEY